MLGWFASMGCLPSAQVSAIPEDDVFLREQTARSKKIDREIEGDRMINQRG